jgi:hypothetical protein
MSDFSRIVLDHTLQLTAEAIPTERALECIETIHRYLTWIAEEGSTGKYRNELREAVGELSGIAFQHGELVIAARLQNIVGQLTAPFQTVRTFDQSHAASWKTAIVRLLLG